jgi:hypothetical protein
MADTTFDTRSALESFPATWRRVVTEPHAFFADMPETGGLGAPAAFLAACAALNALGHVLMGWGIGGAIAVFVGQMIGAVVLAALLVLIAQHLFDGHGGFEPTFRVVAYAAAPLVVFWVPIVGRLAWLYGAYLILRGVERVQKLDATRAVLTVVIGVAALWLLGSLRAGGPVWF